MKGLGIMEMGKLYVLFKTDYSEIKGIVAVHESLEVVLQQLKNNSDMAEPKRLGQGWRIDLMTYDDSGKTDMIPVNQYTKELVNCRPDDIREGEYYNIIYKNNDIRISDCPVRRRGIGRTKCISSCPPDFVFSNREKTGLHLNYEDIIVISKCRESEDNEDWERFQFYSHLLEWKMEHEKL